MRMRGRVRCSETTASCKALLMQLIRFYQQQVVKDVLWAFRPTNKIVLNQ